MSGMPMQSDLVDRICNTTEKSSRCRIASVQFECEQIQRRLGQRCSGLTEPVAVAYPSRRRRLPSCRFQCGAEGVAEAPASMTGVRMQSDLADRIFNTTEKFSKSQIAAVQLQTAAWSAPWLGPCRAL